MSDYATCPHCDCNLFSDECFDIESDNGKIISYWKGHCLKCEKSFSWREIYLFDCIEGIMEDDDNND